ncbi:MAG: dTDP-Rha:A-D-GlcNAc-diphosphoryl polyprenol, A-3-L-rhamnosyl transferase WbbL [uncultured Rubrobacteraceae bacterium]|uniref:dTDP-Rha:A-D-GlcNAc-diphosphoryl polyprenol, A-3-L-rhamnosyl transferase WbbL n=1 Tax=uncultured Rubrobacteraceae bacterium TaxID=349277 RepID=A0A6J4QGV3_9ACTN|nr:MAG: dTDP-Rha:A-D-GlcNAc-diphosphoryl polyprenol, A-3-L-rhamnosyl transferase WbbL [uncultured Rubrobacteraceae bacterium]
MRFSVIIVNYHSWPLTLACVASLRATGREDVEIVVVDNDAEEVPDLPPDVRLIRSGENLGLTRAWNRTIPETAGELIVLLNPDTVVEEDFFGRVETFFDAEAPAGVAGPRILDADGELQLSARKEISLLSGLLGRTSLLTRLFPKSPLVKNQFPALGELRRPTRVDWVSGACMVVRRETLGGISPLDERFFLYFEDADLCRRAREAGWRVFYLPEVEVLHQTGGSSRSKPRAIWLLHKSAFLYHRKHGPHGPLNLYSAAVFLGLAARALVKLAASEKDRVLKPS